MKTITGALGAMLVCAQSIPASAQQHPIPPSQAVPPVRFVTTLGQRMAYYDLGEGPPLILVHGSGVSAAIDWGQVIRPLSRYYRVIAIDNIGHGQSGKPNMTYNNESYAAFLAAFLRELGLTHAYFAGQSMGGGIVTYYAIKASQPGSDLPRVDKLIITDGAVPVPGWSMGGAASARPATAGPAAPSRPGANVLPATWQDYKARVNRSVFVNPDYLTDEYAKDAWSLVGSYQNGIAQQNASAQDSPESQAIRQTFDEHLKDIKVPTLIIWGQQDVLIPVQNATYINKAIGNSKLIVYPDAGHGPGIEHPDRYTADVHKFLN